MFRPKHSDFISVVFVSFRFLNFRSEVWNCLCYVSSPEQVKKLFAKSTHRLLFKPLYNGQGN